MTQFHKIAGRTAGNAAIIAPFNPNGTERARVHAHPNAAAVWEGRTGK